MRRVREKTVTCDVIGATPLATRTPYPGDGPDRRELHCSRRGALRRRVIATPLADRATV